jgi:hypothetical protein
VRKRAELRVSRAIGLDYLLSIGNSGFNHCDDIHRERRWYVVEIARLEVAAQADSQLSAGALSFYLFRVAYPSRSPPRSPGSVSEYRRMT